MTPTYEVRSLAPHSTPGFCSWSCSPIPGPPSWYSKCACVFTCVCVGILCVEAHGWMDAGADIEGCYWLLSTLHVEAGSPTELRVCQFATLGCWFAGESPCLCLLVWGLQLHLHTCLAFTWALGIWTWGPRLVQQMLWPLIRLASPDISQVVLCSHVFFFQKCKDSLESNIHSSGWMQSELGLSLRPDPLYSSVHSLTMRVAVKGF